MWKWIWLGYATLGLVLEFIALLSHQPGATLSQNVWALKGSGFFSIIIFFLLWFIYHLIFENGGIR